ALHTLRADARCALLLTLRSDFYPDLAASALWPVSANQRLELASLRGAALRTAIQQPALACGVRLEPGLLDCLVADAADEPAALPTTRRCSRKHCATWSAAACSPPLGGTPQGRWSSWPMKVSSVRGRYSRRGCMPGGKASRPGGGSTAGRVPGRVRARGRSSW